MKRALIILFLLAALCSPRSAIAQFPVTHEVNGTFDASSYDYPAYKFWGDYFADYFYSMYPQFTNHIYSVSRSGASWESQFKDQQQKYCLPLWASFLENGSDWMIANDNGGYTTTNLVNQWGTNLFNAPPLFWDGSAVTDYSGIVSKSITHYALGGIPNDSSDGDSGAINRNLACLQLAGFYSTPPVDLWHLLWNNGLSGDVVGSRLFGFYSGGHPYPAGHLCMTLKTLIALGAETNVGSMTLDWNNQLVSNTNKMTVINPSLSGNTLTFTVHFDRMPPAWDVPNGTITNDARNAFVVMPELGNAFRWIIQVTNLPVGNYELRVDGILTDIATSAQLAAGRNWFTNYNGPLWLHRVAVLAAKREQDGVDPVTLVYYQVNGNLAIPDVGRLLEFQSNAAQQYDTNGKRGSTYVTAMATFVSNLRQYDARINAAAQQTNHTFTVTLLIPRFAPYRR